MVAGSSIIDGSVRSFKKITIGWPLLGLLLHSLQDGEALALALLENFHACPVPKFLTQRPPNTFPARPVSAKGFKPRHPDGTAIAGNEDVDLSDDREVRGRVAAVVVRN